MLMLKRVGSIVSVTLVSVALAGCQQPTTKTMSPSDPMSPQAMRMAVQERNPNSNVGVVSAVLPDGKFASVVEMPIDQFKVGDVVTFVDSSTTPLANGVVRAITTSALHVEVEQSLPGARPVAVNDLAVRFKP